jgi:DNA replication licensing factor MCM4
MIDEVRPGDRVEITGIFKAMGIRVNPNQRKLKNVYRTYVDVITYLKTDKTRVNVKDKDAEKAEVNVEMAEEEGENQDHAVEDQGLRQEHSLFSEKELREFREFAAKPDLYDQLIDSLAPSIWENQDVKKGILT